jgi:menaquinone-dependent protoporphyrinogen oxidase
MKTAIIYASKHGTTQKVANEISGLLPQHDVTLLDAGKNHKIDLTPYDQIIIGGSIHAGRIQPSLQKFMERNTPSLLQKPLGLFLCCMYEQEAQNQFNQVFPEILRHHATSCQCVGGEFLFEKMNFLEKLMTQKIAGINGSVSKIDHEKIKELAQEMS